MNTETLIADCEDFDIYRRWLEGGHRNEDFHPYGTHQPILIQMFFKTEGRILELGSGDNSTRVLHELCKLSGRELVTIDTDSEWLDKFRDLECDWHKIELQKDYEKYRWNCPRLDEKWGLVLVDNAPGESRTSNIMKLKNCGGIVLVHDAQEAGYEYTQGFLNYKYKYHWDDFSTTTMILSNTEAIKDISSNKVYYG